MNRLTIAVSYASVDDPSFKIISVPGTHRIVSFIRSWQAVDGHAWIDKASDSEDLIKLALEIDMMDPVELPCEIDLTMTIVSY